MYIDQFIEGYRQKARYLVSSAAYVPVPQEISHMSWDILTQGMRLSLCPTVPSRRRPQDPDR